MSRVNIGFLSFGHWQDVPGSQVRTGQDALLQTIELAVAAEEVGVSGAYVRVHHFARQLASPFPLLSAMAARTSTIELGSLMSSLTSLDADGDQHADYECHDEARAERKEAEHIG